MKLQILNPGDTGLTGYETKYLDKDFSLEDVSDNECTEILVKDSFTQLQGEESVKFLMTLCAKLRKNGSIVLNGIDSRTLARGLIRGVVSDKEFNDLVYSCKSMVSIPILKEIVHKSGLKIKTLNLKGVNYDLTATR